MTELHEQFRAWLLTGARDVLARDVAVHASACPDCLRTAAAFDALSAVDPGAASAPGAWEPGARFWTPRAILVARTAAGVAAAALIIAAGFVAAGSLLGPRAAQIAARQSPQGEGVLGNAAGPPSASASATAKSSESSSASPTAEPSSPGAAATNPPMGGGPPPISTLQPTPTPRPATVQPTPAPTPRPTPRVTPTPVPTQVPTPVPTPVPTLVPTPVPDDCADGIDNDGDELIDGLDPGCAVDGNEASG